jgi:RNA polymerase sigma-70 factor (ECF subfamily)
MYRGGDADAFETLFDRYHRSVYQFSRFMLHDTDGAADVMQETFLAVARGARNYKPVGRFRAWLMRIARNLCLNHLRSRRTRLRAFDCDGIDQLEATPHEATVSDKLESDERVAEILQLVRQLPEKQREALALRVFEGMSYREIGDVLGAPLNTVKTWIHRARCTLAERLEQR